MSLNISEQWLRGCKNEEERAEAKKLVLTSEKVLDKLGKILYNMQEDKKGTVLGDYDTPSWSHKQAHLNGEQMMLKRIIDLVTIHERDDQPTK